ncbi:FAD-dependent oxidoreductase [Xenorhabdus sp. 12]|uniref:FAD-dependent oxidoreductase n=1 Tax=Xenorhabdus santafensis TaxID=2582833 RepID=A0ABU4SCW8_9GAMM|nr:BBE domain-containing protein [Xenorhabdus sp. 12]MDX7988605.1 FAD-dependent oxidoreductase [Xenorhabdus sp. 12]
MADNYINKNDIRFNPLKKGFNLRWPDKDNDVAGVFICKNEVEVSDAAYAAVFNNGKRITIRSGGHCYEGFVSNNTFKNNDKLQDTVIIDAKWMELYYGEKISQELIEVKTLFDAGNIFRHEMSIPLKPDL